MNGNRYSSETESNSSDTFDPADESSWNFGDMSREDCDKLLDKEQEDGVFVVRESTTKLGNMVLCVKESGNGKDPPISHYLIDVHRQKDGSPMSFSIGDQSFMSMSSLLSFYKSHYLETTPLTRPAPRKLIRVRAKFDFIGQEYEDLSFKKHEILYIIKRDPKSEWLIARNSLGQCGSIPANYVEESSSNEASPRNSTNTNGAMDLNSNNEHCSVPAFQKTLPAYAKVTRPRRPNAYDKTALRLEVNDRIKVLVTNPSGTWEGEMNGKIGTFPFTHVEWEDENKQNDNVAE